MSNVEAITIMSYRGRITYTDTEKNGSYRLSPQQTLQTRFKILTKDVQLQIIAAQNISKTNKICHQQLEKKKTNETILT